MSDFSELEQSLALPALAPQEDVRTARGRAHAQESTRSYDVKLSEVEFRRLHAADEVHAIQRMRAEIQLPGTALADPGFFAREKKRTEKGWSVHSNGRMRSSGR
ncbi:hypothetical protein JJB11_17045 [Ramlibacter ginsenosidimutans]|uniref:Uncharacterized protein n=1 Tax=Ramlibacter ginsenosidimutans TaxID=502333 RepID=A0A934TUP1_9BURK|nr:hypothetical protein [Ramlibacter ginsenosidimutans]MBK6007809.1 hypothetical protein [Ramlibacter ginsenosidimutans]